MPQGKGYLYLLVNRYLDTYLNSTEESVTADTEHLPQTYPIG